MESAPTPFCACNYIQMKWSAMWEPRFVSGMFWSGSRYGRSSGGGGGRRQQGGSSPVEVAARNDRFFIGSRYGKRSEEPVPTTDGTCPISQHLIPTLIGSRPCLTMLFQLQTLCGFGWHGRVIMLCIWKEAEAYFMLWAYTQSSLRADDCLLGCSAVLSGRYWSLATLLSVINSSSNPLVQLSFCLVRHAPIPYPN
jgi:hypothetical protein